MARTQRPHRRLAVSAAARSLAADSGLGYLAGHGAQTRVRSLPLRALALLEGVRHRGRRRPAGPPHQRHDVHVRDQRAAETGFGGGRHPALEGRSQHARRARRRLLLRRPTGVHAAESGHRDARGVPHPGIEGRSGRDRIDAELGAANRQGQLPQLLHGQLPHAMREAYLQKWHEENDPKLGQATAMPETISFSGPDFDDVRPHLWTFFEAVRTRKPVVEDVVFGHNAALACHMANESYFRKSTVSWDEASKTIKGG